eukprot:153955_1
MGNEIKPNVTLAASFDQNTKITKCRWRIPKDHIDKLKDLSNKSHIESDHFETNKNDMKATWYLRCYPKGYNNTYVGRCQIFLYLSSLSNAYKNIRVYYYIKYINNNASVEDSKTFSKVGDESSILPFPLLSDLQYTNPMVFEIGIRVLKIIDKNNNIIYGLSLPLSSIKPTTKIKWHLSNKLINTFQNSSCGKCISSMLFPNTNNMFTVRCYPNGISEEGQFTVYLRVIVFPNGIHSMKIKYTITCPQVNISKTNTSIRSERDNDGGATLCTTKEIVEHGPLDIIIDIEFIEFYDTIVFDTKCSKWKKISKMDDEKKEEINNTENKIAKYEDMIMKLQNEILEKMNENGKCKTLLSDYLGIYWCPHECKASISCSKGTCPKNRSNGQSCSCKGQCSSGCCEGSECVAKKKDYLGIKWCPADCKGGIFKKKGTC